MPVSFGVTGGSTKWPGGPPNDWMTPTEWFPGAPTIAIVIVTTPPFVSLRADDPEAAVVAPPEQPAAPTASTASDPIRAFRCFRMRNLLERPPRTSPAQPMLVG